MKKLLFGKVLLTSLLALACLTARADEEQDQIAILRTNANLPKKWAACQRLRQIGTEKTVEAVAPLLTDRRLSQAARQTLDGLPYPEVDEVLRAALGKTQGLLKAGIIDTIGWRGKTDAEPLLIPFLKDSDHNIASAAAIALGRLGGKPAVDALTEALESAPPLVQPNVESALLQCADTMLAKDDKSAAAEVFGKLNDPKYPAGVHYAAWRGLVLSDEKHQIDLMIAALTGTDLALERVAMKTLRESTDTSLIKACADKWDALPPEGQVAVIAAESKQGKDGLDVIRAAGKSSNASVRVAAWNALGELNDVTSISVLAQAAGSSTGHERDAARESLARMSGPGASEALMAELKQASGAEKEELLRALGARQESQAAAILMENAATGDASTRMVALDSLREIAPPEALAPLLEIAAKADSDDIRSQALEALSAVCQANQDKTAATKMVVEAQSRLPDNAKAAFLPLLSVLGTPDAMAALQTAVHSPDVELAKEGVRVLGQWPTAAPAEFLLDVGKDNSDPVVRTLAVRGAIAVIAAEENNSRKLDLLKRAMAEASRPDEKKQALGQIGQIAEPAALETAMQALDDPAVLDEASLAAVDIAEKVAATDPQLAQEAAAKVIAKGSSGDLFKRAWALRAKAGGDIPFIRDWVVCGPFTHPNTTGPIGIFKVQLGPELHDQAVEWKDVPSNDQVDLAGIFPGAENCAAYLRTTLVAPEDCSAVLLMGSDDGIKAWLNGKVVHSHNVDRPQTIDEDAAPVHLNKGANELVCKISQGGGGWGAVVRIVGIDGKAIAGLRTERPTGPAGALSESE